MNNRIKSPLGFHLPRPSPRAANKTGAAGPHPTAPLLRQDRKPRPAVETIPFTNDNRD